jgi:hypothetical protein
LPNSWWKKLSAFVYIHKVFTRIKNKNIGYLTH